MTRSLFALPALLLALAAPAQAAPALWSISDDDSTIWLFGSFHLLPPDLDWRTDLFSETLEKADVVYF
ncbi:TraB/GumN family protein [Devosia sp. A8/3-2]|nr:TraB/GumN family protein [Devosia sp. A8/3-2]